MDMHLSIDRHDRLKREDKLIKEIHRWSGYLWWINEVFDRHHRLAMFARKKKQVFEIQMKKKAQRTHRIKLLFFVTAIISHFFFFFFQFST